MKQAIGLLTTVYNQYIENYLKALYDGVKENNIYDVFLFFDKKKNNGIDKKLPIGIKYFEIQTANFQALGYHKLLPFRNKGCSFLAKPYEGTTQWILAELFKKYSKYDYAWLIEDDVYFNGNWKIFFDYFIDKKDDLITSHIQDYNQFHNKWWLEPAIKLNTLKIDKENYKKSFNVIFRLSKEASNYLVNIQNENFGHNEIWMPTVLYDAGYSIKDLGGTSKYVYEKNLWYDCYSKDVQDHYKSTIRYAPYSSKIMMNKPNKLYHAWKKEIHKLSYSKIRQINLANRHINEINDENDIPIKPIYKKRKNKNIIIF